MKDTSIKDALQKGTTEDELIQQLRNQIKDANAEIAQEEKKKEEVAKQKGAVAAAHSKLITDIEAYLRALNWGISDNTMTSIEKDLDEALDRIEATEVTVSTEGEDDDDDFWPWRRHWLRHWFPWF